VLCDDRYKTREYYSNFPSHWADSIKYVGSTARLEREICGFWNE